jgi:hypothetical protein
MSNTWTCEACQKEFVKGRDRPKDAVNKPDPTDPWAQTPLIYICEDCGKLGFLFQYGELKIYPDSPADNPQNQQPRVTSGDAYSFNPFHDMSTWPMGSGKPPAREYQLRDYYRKKRR